MSRSALPPDHFAVGEIQRAHGIRGEVKVRVLSDNEARFQPAGKLAVTCPPFALTVQHVRTHKGALLIQFAEIATRTEADLLRGAWLSVAESQVASPDPGSYWIHDIIGCQVKTEEGRSLGRIRQVLATGANDVYEVKPDAALEISVPILLPATPDVIRDVDIEQRLITVHLLPGLIEGLA